MTPKFSIITVTYNAALHLLPTLESVKCQSYKDFEYIIMDGASKDNTIEIASNSGIEPIKIVSEPDKGLYDAMNKAMDMARGEYLIFLNAGDSFASGDSLHEIADTAKRTHADIIYGQTDLVNSDGAIVGARHLSAPLNLVFESFKNGMVVCHQAFVARRKIAHHYDLKYRFSADYEWCLRCLNQSKRNAYTGTVLIHYLIDGMTDANQQASLRERFRIMCRYYGVFSTVIQHLIFVPRFIKEKKRRKKIKDCK